MQTLESKKITDYLHLYLGAKITTSLKGTVMNGYWYDRIMSNECDGKLLLRPLNSMTQREAKIFGLGMVIDSRTINVINWTPARYTFALSKHFDLFGLIEAGLAIDKTQKQ